MDVLLDLYLAHNKSSFVEWMSEPKREAIKLFININEIFQSSDRMPDRNSLRKEEFIWASSLTQSIKTGTGTEWEQFASVAEREWDSGSIMLTARKQATQARPEPARLDHEHGLNFLLSQLGSWQKDSSTSQNSATSCDQAFKHMSLWRTFHIQTITQGNTVTNLL